MSLHAANPVIVLYEYTTRHALVVVSESVDVPDTFFFNIPTYVPVFAHVVTQYADVTPIIIITNIKSVRFIFILPFFFVVYCRIVHPLNVYPSRVGVVGNVIVSP